MMDDETTQLTEKPASQVFYEGILTAVRNEACKHPGVKDMDVMFVLSFMVGSLLGQMHPAFHQVMRARVFKYIEESMNSMVLASSEPAGNA